MSEEEFNNYCDGLMDMDSSSNVLKLIQSNLKILSELKNKQKLLKQETFKLQSDINTFREEMQNKFYSCLNENKEKFTNNIEGYKRKHVLDDSIDEVIDQSELLKPLKPLNISLVNSDTYNDSTRSENLLNESDKNQIDKLVDKNITNN